MQITDFWYKRHLRGRKVGFLLLFVLFSAEGFAQRQWSLFNSSGGDDQAFSYGFFLAGHTSSLRIKYSDDFLNLEPTSIRNVRAIMPTYSPVFALGFLLSTRLHDQMNILITPKVGFYEYRTQIDMFSPGNPSPGNPTDTDNSTDNQITTNTFLTEETLVEVPILFKYKSHRFNNTRMFFVGGVK